MRKCLPNTTKQHTFKGMRDTKVTGKTYRFATFQEMVDVLPADRIRDCMDEIGAILGSAKATIELMTMLAQDKAKQDGKEITIPTTPERIMGVPDFFEWNDDGKKELEGRICAPKGEEHLLSVLISPK